MQNDLKRKTNEKNLRTSSMGLQNIYGPVETEENMTSAFLKRQNEKQCLNQTLSYQMKDKLCNNMLYK